MDISQELLEEIIYRSPLTLLRINDKEVIKRINSYLPYSVGMEFECYKKDTYNQNTFKSIPDIMAVLIDSREQRYRIPSGIQGFMCLYNICSQMKNNSKIDLFSSNHYHIDLTDCKGLISSDFQKNNSEWIIEELKTWGTATDLSRAMLGSWYKYNDLGTLEVRIGEPSFDYEVIVNRIIQASRIAKKIKELLRVDSLTVKPEPLRVKEIVSFIKLHGSEVDYKAELDLLNDKLKELAPKETTPDNTSEYLRKIKDITNNRTIKINDLP